MISLKSARNLIMGIVVGGLGLLNAGIASAQSIAQPPVTQAVDVNGINLADGTFQVPGADVSIGNSSSGIARVTQGASDNFSGAIRVNLIGSNTSGTMVLEVSYGGALYRFAAGTMSMGAVSWSPGPYSTYNGRPSFLSCTGSYITLYTGGTCTLHLSDGSTATYSNLIPGTGPNGDYWGMLQTVSKPDGETISVNYYTNGSGKAVAIKSVNSSLGWMLKYEVDGSYVVTKVTAINTAVTYCDPAASSCSVSSSYPYVTSTVSGTTTTIGHNGVTTLTVVGGSPTSGYMTTPNGVTKAVISGGSKVSSVTVGGSTWSYTYSTDGPGNTVTTVGEPNGYSHNVAVNNLGQIVYTTDEFGRKTVNSYNSQGFLIKSVAPDGDPNTGGFTLYNYDSLGRLYETDVVPKSGASGGTPNAGAAIVTKAHFNVACDTTNFTNFNVCYKPDYTTDANGVVTTYTYYTTSGDVQSITTPAPSGGVAAQTVNYQAQITPRNYDVPGSLNVLTSAGPVWRTTITVSCMAGAPGSCLTNADGRFNLLYYGPPTSPTYPNVLPYQASLERGDGSLLQSTLYTSYDNNGNLTSSYGPKGAISTVYNFYDNLNRYQGTIGMDPDGSGPRHRQGSLTTYDNDGHVQEVDTGTVNGTSFTDLTNMVTGVTPTVQERNTNHFDSYGRPDIASHYIGTSTTAKDITQRSYDAMQRVSCEAVRLNQTADFPPVHALPTSACVLGTTNSDGSHDRITAYNYDAAGQVTSTVSAYATPSSRTAFTKLYDTYTTTSTGTLTYVEDAYGNRTTYYYDNFDRLVATCYPSPTSAHTSSTTDCEHTTYRTSTIPGASQAGTLVWYVNLRDNQQITFTYDAVGRLSNKSGAVSESFTYDNFNQVLTHTNNTTGGTAVTETYTYNSLGWLLSDAQPMGTVTYDYDAYGRRQYLRWPSNLFYIGYAYDDADELAGMSESGVTPLVGFDYDDYGRRSHLYRGNSQTTTYSYDSSLRLLSIAHPFNTQTLGYSNADQVVSANNTNTNFTYLTSASATINYGINGLNQIATVNTSTSMGYDTRGNLNSDGGGGSYTYNANNLMTSATQSGITTSLIYDAENRLRSISNATYGMTQFLYDGSDVIADYDGSGNLLHRYVHGPGDDEPLVAYDASANKAYLHADDQGSIVAETNGSGTPTITATYNEYGLPGTSYSGRFQYTGQMWLKELGMYYYKARLYHPVLGRFMQTDPIGYGDGMNWYNYVHGDPMNGTDSTGLAQGGPDEAPVQVTVDCDPACQQRIANNKYFNQLNSNENLRSQYVPTFLGPGNYTFPSQPKIDPKTMRAVKDSLCGASQTLAQWSNDDTATSHKWLIVDGVSVVAGPEAAPVTAFSTAVVSVFGLSSTVEHGMAGVAAGVATGNWKYLTYQATTTTMSHAAYTGVGTETFGGGKGNEFAQEALKSVGDALTDFIGDKVAPNPCEVK